MTGSNGKTIIKDWLGNLLQQKYNIVKSPKSYNSQIGVPLSILRIEPQHDLGIFEAGISMRDEMNRLQKIIRPEIGILTYMGNAHSEGFTSQAEKIEEKLKLFRASKQLICNNDDELVNERIIEFKRTQNSGINIFTWGKNTSSNLVLTKVEKEISEAKLYCIYNQTDFVINIPFVDDASIFNAMTCCATLLSLNYPCHEIAQLFKDIKQVEMRMEFKQGINQCSIINDSYNIDLDSIQIALDFLSQQVTQSNKTIILSDVYQSALSEEILYQKIAALLKQKNIHRIIGIGNNIERNAQFFDFMPKRLFFQNTSMFLQAMPNIEFNKETILLKGGRVFEFEKIAQQLELKSHDTVLEINLNAIRNNLKMYKNRLNPGVKMMAMVKAFSYGTGTFEIANLLQHEGVDYLAVAYTDEGVELRRAGVKLPIMVMNTNSVEFDKLVEFNLEPELYSFSILRLFKEYLEIRKVQAFPIHIKLDTGMHRLGFMGTDIEQLCAELSSCNQFKIKSVFSHLVGSESEVHDAFTNTQFSLFQEMTTQISQSVGYDFLKHLCNTSAIHRHPNIQFNMVRLGIGLYGVDSHLQLQNVTTLKTTIAQIKKIKKGDTVGYGRRGVLENDSTIATVRIGYADGYSRIFGNGNGYMLVNGQVAKTIGNVCMDMTMIDVTEIETKEGDEVIVFGTDLSVHQLASMANTIPYEILTNISQRVKRVYFEE
ncbi:MAG: bifunctional UDP-N-acetylmuramoyl-tripeptide:D-alanyl-D-alanine ligase/alanine racemase [Sphingobacteriales bacterium]|nr:bifunctional UDP-N-acetylmuramoyl-tripeptide:D-alanyl-D-alanine ligase/alanine racemase [Sphingobacteriales bacterium]